MGDQEKWYKLFRQRHADIRLHTPQNLTEGQAKITEENIQNWFHQMDSYFEEKNLKFAFQDPHRIFNCNESALYLAPKCGRVLARRGDKTVYTRDMNSEKENLTFLFTCNAAGNTAPPMIYFFDMNVYCMLYLSPFPIMGNWSFSYRIDEECYIL